METAALCKPIQRFADLLRIPGTWVLTGLGKLLAALGSFPHFPQPLRLLHTHLYWRFLECQLIEVTLTQNGHLTHHEIPSVASLQPGGYFPRIGWPVSPEYASLDELPELLNVIKGEMSLVGPRPLLMDYLSRYSVEQRRRQEILPGVTGWAQIHGRNQLSWAKRLAMDVWYVDNLSLGLDLRILVATGLQVIKREGITEEGHAPLLSKLAIREVGSTS